METVPETSEDEDIIQPKHWAMLEIWVYLAWPEGKQRIWNIIVTDRTG